MISLSVRADLKRLQRNLDDLARRQVPFAAARALTAVAKKAAGAEKANMQAKLDRPSPFTLGGVTVAPATKQSQTAVVYIKDIQARYLAPEIEGGKQVLGKKRAVLAPKNVALNRYGNLPKGLLARLKGRQDIFIGTVTFGRGERISGVWQMPPAATATMRNAKGKKVSRANLPGGHRTGWKLLIRFADPVEVKTRIDWGAATRRVVTTSFTAEFNAALGRAIASAKP